MAELGLGALADIFLDLSPIPFIVANLLAHAADRQEAVQGLDPRHALGHHLFHVAVETEKVEVGVDPCQQLFPGDRFGQIIVGPTAESRHQVADLVLGGQENDRQCLSTETSAQPAADLVTRDLRHHDVEQDEIEALVLHKSQGRLTTGGLDHPVSTRTEMIEEHRCKV